MPEKSNHSWNPKKTFHFHEKTTPPLKAFSKGLVGGDTTLLSRAITLAESQLTEHKEWTASLLDLLINKKYPSWRIAITGAPGVGKSSFIECIGEEVLKQGLRLAVLAVDPSSKISGGSILGDKTRMTALSKHPMAYIRPTPLGDNQGGVNASIRESILLCEATGFDVILIETVGVGQSETRIHDMVDAFILLIDPGAGDDLQGIKRGIIELADILFITKADQSKNLAQKTKSSYEVGLNILKSDLTEVKTQIHVHDSFVSDYSAETWNIISEYMGHIIKNNSKETIRDQQQNKWFNELLHQRIQEYLFRNVNNQVNLDEYLNQIRLHKMSVPSAVQDIIKRMGS